MPLKILTEVGSKIGFGHYVRMNSIKTYVEKQGIDCTLYVDTQENIVDADKAEWKNEIVLRSLISEKDVVVVDSYLVDLQYMNLIRSLSRELIIIDDNQRLPYRNMTIINPNYYAGFLNHLYHQSNKVYIGKDATLLREEFYKGQSRIINRNVTDILISFGGSDVKNMTGRVIDQLKSISTNPRLHVIITNSYENQEQIIEKLHEEDELVINASANKMRNLMGSVDFAVCSAGSTSNEIIKKKCPSMLMSVADNQDQNIHILSAHQIIDQMKENELQSISRMFDYDHRLKLFEKMCELESNENGQKIILEYLLM